MFQNTLPQARVSYLPDSTNDAEYGSEIWEIGLQFVLQSLVPRSIRSPVFI